MTPFERFIFSCLGSCIGAFTGMMLALSADRAIQKQNAKRLLALIEEKNKEQEEHIREFYRGLINGENEENKA